MRDYNKEYYEQSFFWNRDYLKIPAEKERIQEMMETIPSDTQSILDVGCGNGTFVNFLVDTFPDRFNKVIGLDTSKEALKYVKSKKIKGTITNLPFKDKSFDLVTCLEVLEHLPQDDFKKGILELQRVSKRYIIITVPNEDDLEHSLVMCPKCYCWFNPHFHMRSFGKNSLSNLFNNFKLVKIKEIGPYEYRFCNHLLFLFYRALKKRFPPETAICPQCGYQHKKEKIKNIRNNNASHFVLKLLALFSRLLAKRVLLVREKKRWLLVLYEKQER